jgi:hypothetical protein
VLPAAKSELCILQKPIDRLTAGLNRPPDMRKKIQTLTIKLKPKETEIYSITIGLNPAVAFVVVSTGVLEWAFATCVPAKAKNKNRVVPTHSPIAATNMFLTSLFIHIVQGSPR